MSRKTGDTGSLTLANGAIQPFSVGLANYLYVKAATADFVVVLFNGRTKKQEAHVVGEQFLLPGREFDKIQIENYSGGNNTIQIYYGPGQYDAPASRSQVTIDDSTPVDVNLTDGSVTLNQSNIANGATSAPDDSIAADTTEQVVTASGSNVRVRITNLSTNSNTMRVGCHSSVGATNGTPLLPGETWEETTETGVWVHNIDGGAGAESVAIEIVTRT